MNDGLKNLEWMYQSLAIKYRDVCRDAYRAQRGSQITPAVQLGIKAREERHIF